MKTAQSSTGEQVLMAGMIMIFGVLAFWLGKPAWLTRFPFLILGLLFGFACHEFAHVFVASRLGDPTAVEQGRLTLNPLSHLHPVGTFLILTVGIGCARPVAFDPDRIRGGKWGCTQVAAAGPLANLWIAVALLPAIWICSKSVEMSPFADAFVEIAIANFILFGFNLVPIHPLDGGKILEAMVPERLSRAFKIISIYLGILLFFASVGGYFFESVAMGLLVTVAAAPVSIVLALLIWGILVGYRRYSRACLLCGLSRLGENRKRYTEDCFEHPRNSRY